MLRHKNQYSKIRRIPIGTRPGLWHLRHLPLPSLKRCYSKENRHQVTSVKDVPTMLHKFTKEAFSRNVPNLSESCKVQKNPVPAPHWTMLGDRLWIGPHTKNQHVSVRTHPITPTSAIGPHSILDHFEILVMPCYALHLKPWLRRGWCDWVKLHSGSFRWTAVAISFHRQVASSGGTSGLTCCGSLFVKP